MVLLDLSYRRFEVICREHNEVKCSTHVLRVCTVIKITLSQQDVSSALQKSLKFESRCEQLPKQLIVKHG
jgi:hypothetical protein